MTSMDTPAMARTAALPLPRRFFLAASATWSFLWALR
jgi:hypothetical protein